MAASDGRGLRFIPVPVAVAVAVAVTICLAVALFMIYTIVENCFRRTIELLAQGRDSSTLLNIRVVRYHTPYPYPLHRTVTYIPVFPPPV